MSNSNLIDNNEINFLEFVKTIWDGKWKIVLFSVVSFLIMFGFNTLKPNTFFTSVTEIKPITTIESNKYQLYNMYVKTLLYEQEKQLQINQNDEKFKKNNYDLFFEITPNFLLDLFLEQIHEGVILEEGIKKFDLIKPSNFKSNRDYNEAVTKLASDVVILFPNYRVKVDGTPIGSKFHRLKFNYYDKTKWKKTLEFVINKKNKTVQNIVLHRFNANLEIAKKQKKLKIEEFKRLINQETINYEKKLNDWLSYLKNQALIARKLELKKNTINNQFLYDRNKFENDLVIDFPLYLRGYEAIEEQIKLIKKSHIQKQLIPKITFLENELLRLEKDNTIENIQKYFNSTPVFNNNLKSVIVKLPTTKYTYHSNPRLNLILAIIVGGIIGLIYVLINNIFNIRNQKP